MLGQKLLSKGTWIPRKTTWAIIGACFLAFFWVTGAKAAITTSFEYSEGYDQGEVRGQNVWWYSNTNGKADVSASARHTGDWSLEMSGDHTLPMAVVNGSFATSSAMKQCFAYKAEPTSWTQSNIVELRRYGSSGNCGAVALDTIVRVWNGTTYVDIEEPYFTITPDNWINVCMEYSDSGNWVTYTVWNGYASAAITKSFAVPSCDKILLQNGVTYQENDRIFYDSFSGEMLEASIDYGSSVIEWNFPVDGATVNTSLASTTSWTFYYQLESEDAGEDGNLINVHWTGSDYFPADDYEMVSSTTSLTLWQVARGRQLPDGYVFARASLIALDDCIAGGGAYDTTCTWREVAYTPQISFIATSSGGYDIFNKPWDRPSGFYPASTTAADETDSGQMKGVLNRLKNVFPLSIMLQIADIFLKIQASPTVQPASLKLQDIMPDAGKAILGSKNPEILSYDLLKDNLPIWDSVILPFMNACVYLIAFFFGLFLIFPKLRSIDLGGHQKASPDDVSHIETIDLRKQYPKSNLTIDLRKKRF